LAQALFILHFMRKHAHSVRDFLIPIIDFFYPPFKSIMDLQTFRYAACGGGNTLLGLAIYYVSFKYVLQEHNLDLGFYAFKPYNVALFISFIVNFCVGFFFLKFVVFSESNLKGRIQLLRYFSFYIVCLFLNYILLKLFVEYLRIYPTIAQVMTTAIVVVFSYFVQKYFTFRVVMSEEITS
jgi:putative flippase GtrA